MEASLIHASRSIQQRDVKPGYTNIAIMGTLVIYLTAHLFDISDLKAYADMRMKRFYDYTKDLGGFAEYNSPTYTRVALDELVRLKEYILEPSTLKMADYCYRIGWEVLATHFHPPTGQLAAPHSRSYSTLLSDGFYNILYGASDKTIIIGNPKMPENYYSLQHSIPEDLVHYFQSITESRVEIDTFSFDENPVVGYTYLTPQYCIGTANRSTTWQQRRPYLTYWGNTESTRYLRIRLLHDFEDFGIGNIFSTQEKNKILTAMNFAANGGDYHISIDRLEDGKFTAKDVRLRFEMADSSLLEMLHIKEDGFLIQDGPISLQMEMLYTVFDDLKIEVEKGRDEATCWVDYVIYSGENKDFDLTEVEKACFAWYTEISDNQEKKGDPQFPEINEEENNLSIQKGTLHLSVPVVPALEEDLQNKVSW